MVPQVLPAFSNQGFFVLAMHRTVKESRTYAVAALLERVCSPTLVRRMGFPQKQEKPWVSDPDAAVRSLGVESDSSVILDP